MVVRVSGIAEKRTGNIEKRDFNVGTSGEVAKNVVNVKNIELRL